MHALQVLGDPVRRSLIAHLAEGEQAAGALVARAQGVFGITGSAVSQHLSTLRAHGFATVRPMGRQRIYRLAPAGFQAAEQWLAQMRPFWEDALDRLGEDLAEG